MTMERGAQILFGKMLYKFSCGYNSDFFFFTLGRERTRAKGNIFLDFCFVFVFLGSPETTVGFL